MEVRLFKSEDAEVVSHLILRNLHEVLIQDYPLEAIEAFEPFFTPERLVEKSRNQHTLVSEIGDEVVGTASLDHDRVRGVFVDVDRHRSGIGKGLMSAIEAYAREQQVEKIYLMAGISAYGFYEKLGYKVVKHFDRDLNGIPIAEVHMEKVLVTE